jgi:hypothetical protein
MKIWSEGSTGRGLATIVALACLAGGCGTVGDATYGVPVDAANRPQPVAAPPPLLVSAGEAATYSTTYMGLVEVTFENRTSAWKQVDHVTVDFGSPAKNQSVTIAAADDVDVWERAITMRTALQPIGATTAIEALGIRPVDKLGFWIGPYRPAAEAVAAAGIPADAQASAVPPKPSYPDQYLLTTPFRIPPGLFTKRWILLSTSDNPPGGCISSMILSYETSDHATGRVLLPFKVYGSDWQGLVCSPSLNGSYNQGPG